jgi:hypothetical protein
MFPMFIQMANNVHHLHMVLNKFVIKMICLNLFNISSSQVVTKVSTFIDIKPMTN